MIKTFYITRNIFSVMLVSIITPYTQCCFKEVQLHPALELEKKFAAQVLEAMYTRWNKLPRDIVYYIASFVGRRKFALCEEIPHNPSAQMPNISPTTHGFHMPYPYSPFVVEDRLYNHIEIFEVPLSRSEQVYRSQRIYIHQKIYDYEAHGSFITVTVRGKILFFHLLAKEHVLLNIPWNQRDSSPAPSTLAASLGQKRKRADYDTQPINSNTSPT